MSKVLLIRHAQSANNAKPESQRVCDPGITELGLQQAQRTAQTLAAHEIRDLYCSPFLRSLETTRPIATISNCAPIIRADLFEEGGCYSGHLPGQKKGEPGMGRAQLQNRFPAGRWTIELPSPAGGAANTNPRLKRSNALDRSTPGWKAMSSRTATRWTSWLFTPISSITCLKQSWVISGTK